MFRLLITGIFLLCAQNILAQNIIGKITDEQNIPLIGANVYWAASTNGTVTNEKGFFELKPSQKTNQLVFSYIGFLNDTLSVEGEETVRIQLKVDNTLKEVEVVDEAPGTYISANPIKTQVITEVELGKAACCDLAGCFETEANVEANTTNIITNAKELRILGLSGVYNQVLIDGFPLIQGLSYTYGISSVPGSLVRTIYVSKGANSVLQGYEGMVGQINVLLKDSNQDKGLFINPYINSFLEKQLNVNYDTKIGDKWTSLVGLHTTQPATEIDRDEDGFLDLPKIERYSIYNKWKYGDENTNGFYTNIGLSYLDEQRVGGQKDFDPNTDEGTTNHYGQTVQMKQPSFYNKSSFQFNSKDKVSFFFSTFFHEQNAYFGTTRYNATQTNIYTNIQYERTWQDHQLKAGASYRFLDLNEDITFMNNDLGNTYDGAYNTLEKVPGIFIENSFHWLDDKIVLIAGLRFDSHNAYNWQTTPRALLKYSIDDNTDLRASMGTGWRCAHLFSENIQLLASSRDIIFPQNSPNDDINITDQLKPEKSLNYGINFTHQRFLNDVVATLNLDLYHTRFSNQIVPDYDSDPNKAYIENFSDLSVSNGFLAEVILKLFDSKLETKFAYNYLDVFRDKDGEKHVLPFNTKHKVNAVVSYLTTNKAWQFDLNAHWNGQKRLPHHHNIPTEYQLPHYSQDYFVANTQITRNWDNLSIYMGCENIFDFRQERPIVSWENPFGPYFDTASVWGPTKGRELSLGLRWYLLNK